MTGKLPLLRTYARRAAPHAAIAAVHAAVLLMVFYKVWLVGAGDRMFFGWDTLREYWPDLVFPANAIAGGEAPLWNPYVNGGHAFHGDAQAGLTSPLNWFLWLVSWISGSEGAWLSQLKALLGMWIGMVAMHALVFHRTRSHAAGAITAIVYILGSPLLVNKNSALMWPLEYLPLVILTIELYTARPTIRRAVAMSGAVWLCHAISSPPSLFYCVIAAGCYWAFRTLSSPEGPLRCLRAQLLGLAVTAVVVFCLTAAAILPSWDVIAVSNRADVTAGFILQQPLGWDQLAEILVPNLDSNWATDLYMGPLALILGLAAILWPNRDRENGGTGRHRISSEPIFWLVLGLFSLALALGRETPVLPFLVEHVPGFDLFRISYRYKVIWAFCLALLAGDGFALLFCRQHAHSTRKLAYAIAGLGGLWLLGALLAQPGASEPASEPSATAAVRWSAALGGGSLLLAAALAWLRSVRRSLRLACVVAIGALVFVDLWVAGLGKINILQRPPNLEAVRTRLAALPGLTSHEWRFASLDRPLWNIASIVRVRDFAGYPLPGQQRRVAEVWKLARRNPAILAHFNVRWLLSHRKPRGSSYLVRNERSGVYELTGATPLVRVYGDAEVMSPQAVLRRLEQTGPLATALLEPGDGAPENLPSQAMPPVDGELERYQLNRIRVAVDTPQPGIAVLNEIFFRDWQARVNGTPVPVFRANYLLRAVVVPAGASTIEFEYAPPRAPWLWLLFFIGLLVVVLVGGGFGWPVRGLRRRCQRSRLVPSNSIS